MGSFFQSAHICTSDETAAGQALATACQGHALRAWVSPLIGRWLSFFPRPAGSAGPVCREVSDRLKTAILLTTLHDDEVFTYMLFRNGEPVDEFVSDPERFGAVSTREQASLAGDPMKLDGLLDWPEAMFKLVQLLQAGRQREAPVLMRNFFQIVGVVNGLSSYAYLEAGQHQTVALWSRFTHLPDRAAERRAQLAARRRMRSELQGLRADGRLLFDSDHARATAAFRWFSVHCVDPATNGFICSGYNGSRLLQVWQPPAPPRELPGPAGAFVRYGQWCALEEGNALVTHIVGGTVIVDRKTGTARPEFPVADVHLVAADEASRCGYFLKRNGLEARPLHGGNAFFSVPIRPGARRFLVHPHEPHLVWFNQRALGILHRITGRPVVEVEMFNPLIEPKKAAQWRERDIDPTAIPDISREDLLAVELSADGEWLFAGTSEGLRIYRYADIVRARIRMPSPVAGVETSTRLQDHQWVHALAADDASNTIVFSTGGDTLHCFDRITGSVRCLTPSFARKTITQLWLSPQARTVVCWLRGPLDVPKRRDTFSFATWDYDALLAQPREA